MGNYYAGIMNSEAGRELRHHGILGQKWGIRRFQNPDGSLTPAGRERYGVKSTSDSSEFYKNLYNATEDPKQKNRISNFFKSGSSQAQNITRCAEEYKNASSKLDEAFVKYDKLFKKETGKAFDGDGTEAHWQFEERYPEYRKLSENEQNTKRELLKSIKDASDKGVFNGLVDISDYERRYTYNNTTTVDKNDGKAGVIGYYLAEKYGFPFFHEDLETRTFTDNKTGKKETYWPAFNEGIDDIPKTGMPKTSGYSLELHEKQIDDLSKAYNRTTMNQTYYRPPENIKYFMSQKGIDLTRIDDVIDKELHKLNDKPASKEFFQYADKYWKAPTIKKMMISTNAKYNILQKKYREELNKATMDATDQIMKEIRKLPKQYQDEAKSYAYMVLGYDW